MTSTLIASLRQVDLFEGFDDDELSLIASRCDERTYAKGEVVWNAGDTSDEYLVVLDGELDVWGADGIIDHVAHGVGVGELALLLGEPRSASVIAARPARVLVLSGADFDMFVRNDKRCVTAINKVLSERLSRTTRRRYPARASLVIAVVAQRGQDGATFVAEYLRRALARDLHCRPSRIDLGDADVTTDAGSRDFVRELSANVEATRRERQVAVIDVPARVNIGPEVFQAVADVVIELGDGVRPSVAPDRYTRTFVVRNLHADPAHEQARNASEPFVLPFERAVSGLTASDAAAVLFDHPRWPLSRTLGRLVRAIEGRVVGVALGAGAAFGLAHIGVLAALEEADIPVDLLAGSSMGAVIAAGYATGATASELEAIAYQQSSFRRVLGTIDIATTGDGLLGGSRLLRYFRPYFAASQTFADLVVPARIVATDLVRARRVAIGEGTLADAVRASIAMPPLVAPVVRDGQTLVDGGIVDPVPCDVLTEMGADIVVAVDPVPTLDPRATTLLTRVSRGMNRLNPLAYLNRRLNGLNLLDVVMNSFQVVETELGNYKAHTSDVFIRPKTQSHTWIEFYRAEQIIDCGRIDAREAMPELSDILARRLAAFMPLKAS